MITIKQGFIKFCSTKLPRVHKSYVLIIKPTRCTNFSNLFYPKNKFQKLVHIVGFIIRIYHDTRSPESQSHMCFINQMYSEKLRKIRINIKFLCLHPKSVIFQTAVSLMCCVFRFSRFQFGRLTYKLFIRVSQNFFRRIKKKNMKRVYCNKSNNFHVLCRMFYHLKMESRPLYLKTQSVPRCKHFSSRL